jgi:hypothetical protein
MSDIHIGVARLIGNTRHIEIFFHIPNTNNKLPSGFVSELSDLEQSEIDNLSNGNIVEIKKIIRFHKSKTKPQATARLKSMYSSIATKEQNRINSEYALFGEKIEVS